MNPFFPEDISSHFAAAIGSAVQTQLAGVQEAVAKIVEQNQRAISTAISPFVERMAELAEQTNTASRTIGGYVKAAGLWIPPSVSLSFILDLQLLCKQPNVSPGRVRQYFIDRFNEDDYALLRYFIDSWKKSRQFVPRMKVITCALDAHIRGEYELSIPSLLPVIEGVLIGVAGRSKKGNQSMANFARSILTDDYFDVMKEASKDAMVMFVSGSTFYGAIPPEYFLPAKFSQWLNQNGFSEDQILNRHAILHGVQLNYASPENSLRAFLLLDALSMVEPIRFIDRHIKS